MDKREILIREASLNDLNDILLLYNNYMYDSYMARMGPRFVKHYLKVILGSRECVSFVAENNGVVGFIMASRDQRKIKSRLLLNMQLLTFWCKEFLKNPGVAIGALEVAKYPFLAFVKGVKTELLFISIMPEYRKMGIALKLIRSTLEYMKHKGVREVKVTTVRANDAVNELLKNMGFIKKRSFRLFAKEMNLYTKEIT